MSPSPKTPQAVRVTRARRMPPALMVLAMFVAVVATACGGSSVEASAQKTSEVRPDPPKDEQTFPDESDEFGGDEQPGTEDTLPDLGDLGDEFDDITGDIGDLGDCAALGFAYSGLMISAFTAEDPSAEVDSVIAELKAQAPADVQDDLDFVSSTLKDAAEGGFVDAAGAMSSQEFLDANQVISDWIVDECGG